MARPISPHRHRAILPLAAFAAILPLLLAGPTCGHDFDFHLLSWLEAATQYTHGAYPHWAYTPAYNAGEPRFLFYPPISWTLGALLTLILPIQYAGTAFTFTALTLSGFSAHRLARALGSSPQAANLAATIYLLNPYMLFTAYERSAFAELLAAAILPLLFLAVLAPSPKWQTQTLRTAIPIALLWLTNAPAAVMGCYALAILTTTKLLIPSTNPGAPGLAPETWEEPPQIYLEGEPSTPSCAPSIEPHPMGGSTRLQQAATTIAGTILGLLLPAFYLIPAATERRYVQITLATITGMRPQDHFLFHRMPTTTPDDLFHNEVVRTASGVALILLAAIAAAFVLSRTRKQNCRSERSGAESRNLRFAGPATTLLPLTLLITLLLTPISLPLWRHTPQLLYLQFPWRLCALLAVILLALLAKTIKNPKPYLPLLAALVLIPPAYHFFHQPCDETDAPQARAALYHSPLGTEPTDEYTPLTADNDQLHPSNPPWWFTCLYLNPGLNDPPTYKQTPGPFPDRLTIDMPCPAQVTLNRRAYPNWQITLNGHPVTPTPQTRDDGLLTLTLPQGRDRIAIHYHRTPTENAALALTALALLILLTLWKGATTPGAPSQGASPLRWG